MFWVGEEGDGLTVSYATSFNVGDAHLVDRSSANEDAREESYKAGRREESLELHFEVRDSYNSERQRGSTGSHQKKQLLSACWRA